MLNNVSLLKPLVEPGIVLGKTELIKRVRQVCNNALLLQMLIVFPFSMIGKNEKGDLFFC
jgi:hypothetical protein